MSDRNPTSTSDTDRITRLEEAEAFSERTIEQLNTEMIDFNRRMTDVLNRLDRLEGRVDRLMGSLTELAARESDVETPMPPPPDDPHRPVGQPQPD